MKHKLFFARKLKSDHRSFYHFIIPRCQSGVGSHGKLDNVTIALSRPTFTVKSWPFGEIYSVICFRFLFVRKFGLSTKPFTLPFAASHGLLRLGILYGLVN